MSVLRTVWRFLRAWDDFTHGRWGVRRMNDALSRELLKQAPKQREEDPPDL